MRHLCAAARGNIVAFRAPAFTANEGRDPFVRRADNPMFDQGLVPFTGIRVKVSSSLTVGLLPEVFAKDFTKTDGAEGWI
jgi:hypothetical protein